MSDDENFRPDEIVSDINDLALDLARRTAP
jgi:hypothetical protein